MTTPATSTPLSSSPTRPKTYLIIGASRGIGLEFVRQLLARGDQVIAAVRDPFKAADLWQVAGGNDGGSGGNFNGMRPGACVIHQCDVTREDSIDAFVERMRAISKLRIDYLVLNAGVLRYPNRATEISFLDFALHLSTNTIGPIIIAQKLLNTPTIPISTIVFISSDSGSATSFRTFEDGFGAYAASKAALNQMLRHMAAELKRKERQVCILAVHPGEVMTDMGNIDVEWEVEGIISAKQSVEKMIPMIESKGGEDSGTFWTWDGREHPW